MINLSARSAGGEEKFAILTLTGQPPPLDMEFTPNDLSGQFTSLGLVVGRCFGSKSAYRSGNPKCIFIPNGNVFTLRHGKVWWGDLDLARDKPKLEKVAHVVRRRLFVLREQDGRFDNAQLPSSEILLRAVWCTGGARRIPNFRTYLDGSGLSLRQLAFVVGISTKNLASRHRPEFFLELNRRLDAFRESCAQKAANHGYKKWGEWWTSPHPDLAGQAPIKLRRSALARQWKQLETAENQRSIQRYLDQ